MPPEWHALNREAQVAAEMIASGVTALGKANLSSKGYYNMAFFQLSIGFERAGKIIYVADYCIENSGRWPSNSELKSIGHNIERLFNVVDDIALKRGNGENYPERPNDPINQSIITHLSEFGKRTRYYNLDFLSGSTNSSFFDPIADWYQNIGMPILKKYYPEWRKEKDKALLSPIVQEMSPFVLVRQFSEEGELIDDLEKLFISNKESEYIQQWGRVYTMQIARWLGRIVSEISFLGAYGHRIESLLGIDEPFRFFNNPDSYFRNRKTWSIYRL